VPERRRAVRRARRRREDGRRARRAGFPPVSGTVAADRRVTLIPHCFGECVRVGGRPSRLMRALRCPLGVSAANSAFVGLPGRVARETIRRALIRG
jgi:hypothetical protein